MKPINNIPYYNFSIFPTSSNNILKKINFAVTKGFKVIFINYGSFFPWSFDNITISKYAYTDKVIDKIVNICQENKIEIIPSLSILKNSDFVLKDKKYKYLMHSSIKNSRLDISACGTGKLVEELIDDMYSLMRYSDYLLIELPDPLPEENLEEWSKTMNSFLKRISMYLINAGKKLILGCSGNCAYIKNKLISDNIKFILKSHYEERNIFKSSSYCLDVFVSKITLNGLEYFLSRLSGTEGFNSSLDVGEIIFSDTNMLNQDHFKINLINVDIFFSLLDKFWMSIRTCWEELSLIYSNTDPVYRIKFSRSVNYLTISYGDLNKSSLKILDDFEKKYQPGIIREWLNAKTDSVYSQLKNLENISHIMNDGN